MASALAFWFTGLVVAAFALPVCFRVFRRFPDAGAGLALVLGLMLTSFGYFILRTADLLPYGRGGFVLAIAGLGLAGAAVAGRDRRFVATWRRSWRGVVAAALLFTVAFFGYAAFRSYESAIAGTEQPMDFLFLNTMLESEDYPPEDPWFAGERVSYYYFGYIQAAVLTGASGVEPSTGYNLSLAAVFASSATAAASVAAALGRWALGRRPGNWPLAAAGSSVVLLLFLASIMGAFEFAAAHERYNESLYSAFGVDELLPCAPGETENCFSGPLDPRTTSWYPTEFWFWWDATRLVPNTIIEFPIFSFVLGDLHPHVMSIPGVLLAVALAATLWRGAGPLSWETHRRSPWLGGMLAVVFGGLAFTNAWDVLTCSILLAVAVVARNLRTMPFSRAAIDAASYLLPAAALSVIFYAPWLVTFSSQASGIYAYTGEGTRPAHAFLQFGALIAAAALITVALRRWDLQHTAVVALYTGWLPLLPLLAWMGLALWRGDWDTAASERGAGGFVTLVALGLLLWAFATVAVVLHQRHHGAAPVAAMATLAVLLLYGIELLLLRDIFYGAFPRQNTVFKFAYQAWILFAVAGGAAIALAARSALRARPVAIAALVPAATLVGLGLFYALGAIPNRTSAFGNESNIDGLAALARNDPAEYALTRWIDQNTGPGDVVLEASGRVWRADANGPVIQEPGSDWSEGGRIASRTGRPSLVGWDAHEAQWRGEESWPHIRYRQDAVDAAYLAPTPEAAMDTIEEFGVTHVVVGRVEQSRYPVDYLTDFASFLDVAWEFEGLRVYRVHETRAVPTS